MKPSLLSRSNNPKQMLMEFFLLQTFQVALVLADPMWAEYQTQIHSQFVYLGHTCSHNNDYVNLICCVHSI